eukprot:5018597-Lingulodinium_polyedra.AAC.1
MPPIPWEVGVDDHERALSLGVARILESLFPVAKKPVKRKYFSDDAWALVLLKGRCRAFLRAERRASKSRLGWLLRSAFDSWARGTHQSYGGAVPLPHLVTAAVLKVHGVALQAIRRAAAEDFKQR